MHEDISFPSWIVDAANEHQDQLADSSRDFFDKLIDLLPQFEQSFLSAQVDFEIGVLKTNSPRIIGEELQLIFPDLFIVFSQAERKHFEYIIQMQELGLSLFRALQQGQFYVAATLIRSMLEVVCVGYEMFGKFEKNIKTSMGYLVEAARSRSEKEQSNLLIKRVEASHRAFLIIYRSNHATSIEWSNYINDRSVILADSQKSEQENKINTLGAIIEIGKKSQLPLDSIYALLSEFVHPNAGSKMLIVNTKRNASTIMDALKLGNNKFNKEAALYFVDHLSESLYCTWALALTLHERENDLLARLGEVATAERPTDTMRH